MSAKRMTDEELEQYLDRNAGSWPEVTAALRGEMRRARASEEEKDATIKALVADNAALVKKMRAAGDALHRGGYVDLTTGGDQPGAALLERLQRLSGLLELVAASDTDEHGNPLVSKHLIPEIREALKDV